MKRDGTAPTLTDVARRAGVSLATASRVLGGSRDRVSPALAERVHDAAAALDYVPNAHAKALVQASTSTIGLIVHDVSDPYFSEIARGVLRAASDHARLVMICNSYRDPQRERQYVAELRAQRVDAILMAGSGYTDADVEAQLTGELAAFGAAGGRAALVGRHHGAAVDAVLPDNVGGAALVAQHLADLGHSDVAIVAGPPILTTIEDRIDGFRTAWNDRRPPLRPDRIRHADFTRQGGYEATRALLDDGLAVSALFALNDPMAVGALAALTERGLRVPQDVSLVGFDDIPLATDVTPPLTTVRVPMEEMGAAAVELALDDEDVDAPRQVPFASELRVRQSTASQ